MLSSSYENLGFDSAVSKLYTAETVANSQKTTKDSTKIENNTATTESDEIKNIDYNENNSEKTIAEVLKDYTLKTSEYIKDLSSQKSSNPTNKLTKEDYEKAGMSGYYNAQINLNFSKAITNYMRSQLGLTTAVSSTFSISV